jgi:hypothetical protein
VRSQALDNVNLAGSNRTQLDLLRKAFVGGGFIPALASLAKDKDVEQLSGFNAGQPFFGFLSLSTHRQHYFTFADFNQKRCVNGETRLH